MKPLRTLIALSFVFITTGQLATAAQFIPLGTLPGINNTYAHGVSDDGRVVAGTARFGSAPSQAFRWTDATGMVGLGALPGDNATFAGIDGQQPLSADGSRIAGFSGTLESPNGPPRRQQAVIYSQEDGLRSLGIDTYRSSGISGDGNVVIGYFDTFPYLDAWRWTAKTGAVSLGTSFRNRWSEATDINFDGSIVVGFGGREDAFDDVKEIVKWTEATGMVGTGIFVDRSAKSTGAVAVVSDDGSMIGSTNFVSSATRFEAFYWTEETDMVGLGWLPRQAGEIGPLQSVVRDMTPDGRLIAGWSGPERTGPRLDVRPYVWSEEAGMEDFEQVLKDSHGLSKPLADWELLSIQGMSSNGQFFTGHGNNPDGDREAWLVRLDAPWGSAASDLTGNGFVDFEDLTILLANWNRHTSPARGNLVNPTTTPVNFEDLTVLLADWTGPGPGGSPEGALGAEAVPEPSTLALALVAALVGVPVVRRRRRGLD